MEVLVNVNDTGLTIQTQCICPGPSRVSLGPWRSASRTFNQLTSNRMSMVLQRPPDTTKSFTYFFLFNLWSVWIIRHWSVRFEFFDHSSFEFLQLGILSKWEGFEVFWCASVMAGYKRNHFNRINSFSFEFGAFCPVCDIGETRCFRLSKGKNNQKSKVFFLVGTNSFWALDTTAV